MTLETEEKLGHKIGTEESATKVELELQENKPISCLPWLNTRQHCQLENCGFHMIGLLCENIKFFYVLIIIIGHGFTFLSCSCSHGSFRNLFPQTYADLQNAHFGIEDGQYLIFIGKATSSRYCS